MKNIGKMEISILVVIGALIAISGIVWLAQLMIIDNDIRNTDDGLDTIIQAAPWAYMLGVIALCIGLSFLVIAAYSHHQSKSNDDNTLSGSDRCPKCSFEIQENWKNCPRCGLSLKNK